MATAGTMAARQAAQVAPSWSAFRAQRRRWARRCLEGRLAAAYGRIAQLEQDLLDERLPFAAAAAGGAGDEDGTEKEVVERVQLIEPVVRAEAEAAARGARPRLDGRTRVLRNVACHVFDQSVRQLVEMSQRALNAIQRVGRQPARDKATVGSNGWWRQRSVGAEARRRTRRRAPAGVVVAIVAVFAVALGFNWVWSDSGQDFEDFYNSEGGGNAGKFGGEHDPGQTEPPEEAFEAFDEDGDGYIQFPELLSYLEEEGVAAAEVSDVFSIADEDNDGHHLRGVP